MLFAGRLLWFLREFFITASLALPNRKHLVRVTRALINGAPRRDNLSATARTGATTRGTLFNVNFQEFSDVCHRL